MIRQLRRLIATAATRERLAALAADAAPAAPVSLTLDLGAGRDDWLSLLPDRREYWYWAQPENGDWRLALGAAQHYDSAGPARFAALDNAFAGLNRDWRREGEALACLGFAFDPAALGDLPNARLVLPALLLRCHAGRRSLTLTSVAGRLAEAPAHWLALLAAAGGASATPGNLRRLADPLGERAWTARVQSALRTIATGAVDKLVLARSARLLADLPIAAAPLLAALQERQPGCIVYAHGDGRRTFLGATPERLVGLQAGRVEADALAGTAWPAPAGQPSPAPLSHGKNDREQRIVADAVRSALATLCDRVDAVAAREILHLRQLSHLRTRFSGTLRPGFSLFDLAAALHPTPAVGGSPGAAALAWLQDHGEQRGAWYSGGIGWIAPGGDGEIAVALRCALVAGNEASLWAGAGIVAGSEPAAELAETEAKLQAMLEVFRAPARTAGAEIAGRTGTR